MTDARDYLERRWWALALLCMTQFMVVLDASIVNIALPSIGKEVGISQENLSWVVNGYVLTFGGFLLLGGRMADLLGRRRIFMVGLVIVAVASLFAGFAPSEGALIAARAARASARRSSRPARSRSSRRSSATAPSETRRWAPGERSPAPAAPPACCWAGFSPTASAGSGSCG